MKTIDAPSSVQWRAWLVKHHASEGEVWLVFHKRHTRRPTIAYGDAVEEALCFGWIDSLIKRLDDDRYARKFTPRKADSKWSAANRRRYAQLKRMGRLEPAGWKRPPTGRRYDARRSAPSRVPQYIREALTGRPAARSRFDSLAPSLRRKYIGWIDSAKRQETKLRRVQEAVDLLAAGKTLGLK